SYILKQKRHGQWIDLDDDHVLDAPSPEDAAHDQQALARLTSLIQKLKPQDRQILLLYLEGVDAAASAEITGVKPGHIATKISRIKALLRQQFHQEARLRPTNLTTKSPRTCKASGRINPRSLPP
ncbi:MAG: sigma-70 family RNA polymerase sigma factor, partial [Asticcacaulis sp.]|nr:sigma-70 family RNA polymerase sigma factor [Asticcacaulis sp.]